MPTIGLDPQRTDAIVGVGVPRFDAQLQEITLTPAVGPCWLWKGYTQHGYGRVRVDTKKHLAHRFAFVVAKGPIPSGMQVDHTCHNADPSCKGGESCRHRSCCNPAHLEAVTGRTNTLRGKTVPAAHAATAICPAGHRYTDDNIYCPPGRPVRECRICKKNRDLARDRRARR